MSDGDEDAASAPRESAESCWGFPHRSRRFSRCIGGRDTSEKNIFPSEMCVFPAAAVSRRRRRVNRPRHRPVSKKCWGVKKNSAVFLCSSHNIIKSIAFSAPRTFFYASSSASASLLPPHSSIRSSHRAANGLLLPPAPFPFPFPFPFRGGESAARSAKGSRAASPAPADRSNSGFVLIANGSYTADADAAGAANGFVALGGVAAGRAALERELVAG